SLVPDLLPIIKEYVRTFPIFAIGKYSESYDDYRLVDRNDFYNENFFQTFEKNYYDNFGLLSLGDFEGAILCMENNSIMIDDYYVRCTTSSIFIRNEFRFIKKGTIVKFRTSNHNPKEPFWDFSHIIFGTEIHKYPIGLFVRKDIKFRP